ncbi:MAG TPA: quinolinate synthase NadA [Phycisphaerae bacterium]|nr:quinolinate synthase NadA [Phycisphaerae bacterium]
MTPPEQSILPEEYAAMEPKALESKIAARKGQLGKHLCILGHHYQRDEVIQFADFTGDSLKLSQLAAAQTEAKYIVFCGVHFMAESADILSSAEQMVCLPNMHAGCTMADMADVEDVQAALEEIASMTGAKVVPITYVNSSAAVKALTARADGACCTSSNVRNVFQWALHRMSQGGAGAERIFAIPDQHLGRNTAVAMGYSLDDCVVYDPHLAGGGLTADAAGRAKFILWKGHCYVHQVFKPQDIVRVRAEHKDIRVIVHPECTREVVALADASGSTEQIIRAVEEGAPGSKWAIGTEKNLVNRLARKHPEMFIRVLSDAPSVCAQMARIDLPHLLWVLDNLTEGKVVNRIAVPPHVAADARLALERMINIKAVRELTPGD